jgi:Na+-driven multidrug efflux pump
MVKSAYSYMMLAFIPSSIAYCLSGSLKGVGLQYNAAWAHFGISLFLSLPMSYYYGVAKNWGPSGLFFGQFVS